MNPVVVTGLGLCTSLGENVISNWERLCHVIPAKAGINGSLNTPSGMTTGYARAQELAEKACVEAFHDAGLQDVDSDRVGCTVSASKPFFASPQPSPDGRPGLPQSPIAPQSRVVAGGRSEAAGEASWIIPPDAINDFVVQHFRLGGECRNVVAACATGAYSIALGASWIEQGLCDVVVAGSVEPYPHPLIEAGFRQMGVMSPEGVTRPFDRRRSGFTFGEGAGVVVLESEKHFEKRIEHRKSIIDNRSSMLDSRPYARLSGWALGSDSHSAVAFNSNGARIARVIDRALKRDNISAAAVRHVNAHGTATRLNDWIENQALLKSFGRHSNRLMISATKASTGHLLGASGSVEFIFTVLAIFHQFIPPTATLEEADPECALDYTPQNGHSASFRHALSLSFGFGGPIGALVVSTL